MTEDEYSTEMELYGVSPSLIAIIMFIITILVPYGYIPDFITVFPIFWYEPMIYSTFWVILLERYHFGFPVRLFWPLNLFTLLPLTILNWLYAFWIVRYYQSKSSGYVAIMIGLLSILLPPTILIFLSAMFGTLRIIYPLPIQFILGLILLWRIEGPEVISPWSGMRLGLSWWKWGRPKRKSDWDPFEDEKKTLEKDD